MTAILVGPLGVSTNGVISDAIATRKVPGDVPQIDSTGFIHKKTTLADPVETGWASVVAV